MHRGTVSSDSDRTRRATLLFQPGTTATMTMADGTTQPIDTLSVRATEYTVGEEGPQAPAALPPQSAYTYCVELSADEAVAAGATQVDFSRPVSMYVEDFLHFGAGAGTRSTRRTGVSDARSTERWPSAGSTRLSCRSSPSSILLDTPASSMAPARIRPTI